MIDKISNSLYIFRDDLFPFLGGGNKGRKMIAIGEQILKEGANAIVTTGGIQSNHCRAVAIFAAQYKLKCTLVLHGNQKEFYSQNGNAKVIRLSGAEIIFVKNPSDIGGAMDQAKLTYSMNGYSPYYIWGGGHTLEGGKAYIDAVEELKKYIDSTGWKPDYIFHASGTGSTQAGILAGLDKYKIESTSVIGISVGRKTEQAVTIVNDFYDELCKHYGISHTKRKVEILDQYLMGGYGMSNDDLKLFSLNSIKNYGLMLDTCYTGKAFYGMLDYINKHSLQSKNVLFWHTGGVFNFLAEQ